MSLRGLLAKLCIRYCKVSSHKLPVMARSFQAFPVKFQASTSSTAAWDSAWNSLQAPLPLKTNPYAFHKFPSTLTRN